jgi:hypothetical protein
MKSTVSDTSANRPTAAMASIGQLALVCLLGSVVTLWGWDRSVGQHERDDHSRFQLESERAILALKERLDDIGLVMRSGAGLFSASRDITEDEWHIFASNVYQHAVAAGVLRIGYVERSASPSQEYVLIHEHPDTTHDERYSGQTSFSIEFLECLQPTTDDYSPAATIVPNPSGESGAVLVALAFPTCNLNQGSFVAWLDPQRLVDTPPSTTASLQRRIRIQNLCDQRTFRWAGSTGFSKSMPYRGSASPT